MNFKSKVSGRQLCSPLRETLITHGSAGYIDGAAGLTASVGDAVCSMQYC